MQTETDADAFWYMPQAWWEEITVQYHALKIIEDELRAGMMEDLQRCN